MPQLCGALNLLFAPVSILSAPLSLLDQCPKYRVACSVWLRALSELFLLSPAEIYPAGCSWASLICRACNPAGEGWAHLSGGDLAGSSKFEAFCAWPSDHSLPLSCRRIHWSSPLWTASCPPVISGGNHSPFSMILSFWVFCYPSSCAHVHASSGSMPNLECRLAPLLKDFLCGSHATAPSPGNLFSLSSPSPKSVSLMVRSSHCLSKPPTVLDKVSLWIFPGWHWEKSHSYTTALGSCGMLSLLPPDIFSFRWSCSHCFLLEPDLSSCLSVTSSGLLCWSTDAQLCPAKSAGLAAVVAVALLGEPRPSAPRSPAGGQTLAHFWALPRLFSAYAVIYSRSHSLSAGFSSWLLCP